MSSRKSVFQVIPIFFVICSAPFSHAEGNAIPVDSTHAVTVEFYTLPGCHDCDDVESNVLPLVKRAFEAAGRPYAIEISSVLDPGAFGKLMNRLDSLGIPYGGTPLIICGNEVLSGDSIRVDAIVSAAGKNPLAATPDTAGLVSGSIQAEGFPDVSLLMVVGAGLADGINPCAIATLVYLLSILVLGSGKREFVVPVGAGFIIGVFITYTAIGFGLLSGLRAVSGSTILEPILRYSVVAVLCSACALSFRDAWLAMSGKAGSMTMILPVPIAKTIRSLIRNHRTVWFSGGMSVALGCLVSILEFACTGQVYLPILAYLARTDPGSGIFLLVCYNAAFVLPLCAAFILAWRGIDGLSMLSISKKLIVPGKVLTGLTFAGLAMAIAFG